MASGQMQPYWLENSVEEEMVLRLLQQEERRQQPAAASAKLSNPTALLVTDGYIYASEFRADRVVFAKTAKDAVGRHEWRVFADRGPHCRRKDGFIDCALLDGPWGLAVHGNTLYVASFGSDQILAFARRSRTFLFSLGSSEELDSPEGIAILESTLYVASFLDSRIVAFGINNRTEAGRTVFAGHPVDIDYEAGIFVSSSENRYALTTDTFLSELRGPEQLLAIQEHGHLLVSSLHNDSVLRLDPSSGHLLRADLGAPANGALGIALVPPHAKHLFSQQHAYSDHHNDNLLLLLASYRDDDVLAVDLDVDPMAPNLAATSLGLRTPTTSSTAKQPSRLRGPAALALDPDDPSALYVACYESGSLLFFNLSSSSVLTPPPPPSASQASSFISSSESATRRKKTARKRKRREKLNHDI